MRLPAYLAHPPKSVGFEPSRARSQKSALSMNLVFRIEVGGSARAPGRTLTAPAYPIERTWREVP